MFFGGVMGVRGGDGVGMGKGSVLDPIKPVSSQVPCQTLGVVCARITH